MGWLWRSPRRGAGPGAPVSAGPGAGTPSGSGQCGFRQLSRVVAGGKHGPVRAEQAEGRVAGDLESLGDLAVFLLNADLRELREALQVWRWLGFVADDDRQRAGPVDVMRSQVFQQRRNSLGADGASGGEEADDPERGAVVQEPPVKGCRGERRR